MKVTLITVTYNAERYLEDCIQSVISQSHKNIEYIIVDGGSTDQTLAIIQKNKKHIHKWLSEKDGGMYDALNKGLKLATGNIIGIVNSDDFLASENVISNIVTAFQQGKTDVIYGDLMYVNEKRPDRLHRIWKGIPYERRNFHFGWMPGHPTFYVKKEVVDQLGGYNLKFGTAADFEFMIRYLYRNKISAAYMPQLIIKMRKGGQSNSSMLARIKANRMDYLAMRENKLPFPAFSTFLKPIRKLPQFFIAFTLDKTRRIQKYKKRIEKFETMASMALQKAYYSFIYLF